MTKMADGKQCSVVWHINDLKISHNKKVVDNLVNQIDDK
jgi:hypothetical protein